jgi:pyroglutamyl-peptidase
VKAPVILITGFGPFPGIDDNPSAMIAETMRREGYQAHVLPTEYATVLSRFRDLLKTVDPDIVVCFGVAGKSDRIRLERVAANVMRADLPDAAGVCHAGDVIDADGPATRASTLPLDKIAARLALADVPFRMSDDAGGYLCNFLFYNLMREIEFGHKPRQGGFIHVPKTDVAGFGAEKMIDAARSIIKACVESRAPSQTLNGPC